MKKLTLEVKEYVEPGNTQLWNQLNDFVHENFDLLYLGAVKINYHIEADHYAPRRIQINNTRLHESQGLKIAGGHHRNDEYVIEDDQLESTVADLQTLLDAAGEEQPAKFEIYIIQLN